VWAAGLFFAVGYLVTAVVRPSAQGARAPVYGTAAAVALAIPFAARAGGMLRGALRGLGLGWAASMGIIFALYNPQKPPSQHILSLDVTITVFTTMFCCTAAGAVFALLAERRRRIRRGDPD